MARRRRGIIIIVIIIIIIIIMIIIIIIRNDANTISLQTLFGDLIRRLNFPTSGYIGSNICRNVYMDNKRKRIPKVSSNMDNPEKLIA